MTRKRNLGMKEKQNPFGATANALTRTPPDIPTKRTPSIAIKALACGDHRTIWESTPATHPQEALPSEDLEDFFSTILGKIPFNEKFIS